MSHAESIAVGFTASRLREPTDAKLISIIEFQPHADQFYQMYFPLFPKIKLRNFVPCTTQRE